MRATLLFAALLPLLTAAPVLADSTVDDFQLTAPGTVITFSLPASPGATPSLGAGGADAGFFVNPKPVIVFNANPGAYSQLEFLSGKTFVGNGLLISGTPLGDLLLNGALLYSGTSAKPTFLTGSFNLHNFYGNGTPSYLLTITPEASAAVTPEPSTLVLLGSGSLTLIGLMRRRNQGTA